MLKMEGTSRNILENKDGSTHRTVQFLPVHIGPISTLEELDIKVLKFQNKKLAEKLEERKRTEDELRQRIEQLEKRQMQDDTMLNVVNRYWNMFDENMLVLLQRFSVESTDDSEILNQSEATTSFLMQLSSWDKEELNETLANRVQVSKRSVAKIIQAFDRMLQRYEKLSLALRESKDVDQRVKEDYIEMQREFNRLHEVISQLHQKNYTVTLKMQELEDKLNGRETENAELKNRLDDAEYECAQLRSKLFKFEHHLADVAERLNYYEQAYGDKKKEVVKAAPVMENTVDHKRIEELQEEVEEQKEIAANRLRELEAMNQKVRTIMKENEQLKMELKDLPENIIKETMEYKSLLSSSNVLHNDAVQLRTLLIQAFEQLYKMKDNYTKQLNALESEILVEQRSMRSEILKQEDRHSQLRREYENLRLQYEHTALAKEQSAPMIRELRNLISSLQSHNQQLKSEAQRYRRRCKEINAENERLFVKFDEMRLAFVRDGGDVKTMPLSIREEDAMSSVKEEVSNPVINIPDESTSKALSSLDTEKAKILDKMSAKKEPRPSSANSPATTPKKADNSSKEQGNNKDAKTPENENKDLKAQLRKAQLEIKEVKLLLTMYKEKHKDTRDIVEIMASEKKARAELEEVKIQLKKALDPKRDEHGKETNENVLLCKLKILEEENFRLTRAAQLHSQEEEASLSEMEITGQAFEEMQEQNSKILQMLGEKDDENIRLMTERVKNTQACTLSKEEKETLEDMIRLLSSQLDTVNGVVKRLEDKEILLHSAISALEKELYFCQCLYVKYRGKAIEGEQAKTELGMHLDKYQMQIKDAQQVAAEKTSILEAEIFKANRLQEEIGQLKRKLEKMKKMETSGTLDAVLMEEVKEYKETLTCPSCKVKRKDAVLTKCFHVFCFSCLRTRYETRQRKCPQCNAAFGANDYHRLYLSY